MKDPLAIIFNDAHLKTGNEQDVINSVKHMVDYAVDKNITIMIFAGDMFDSRSHQRQSVLQAFDEILRIINSAGILLYLFPGNHDKTDYYSYDSFLDVYRHYPNVIFNKTVSDIDIKGTKITLLPFFADSLLIPMIDDHKGSDVLISHFEMAGSTNLGRTSKKTSINKKLLSKWKKTYLGHYHNHHEISKDIVHLPSLRQSNFGEDDQKGFSILYDDLSYEIVLGKFKKFIKLTIDVDNINKKDLQELIDKNKESEDIVRFEFVGSDSKLKVLDKADFNNTGIDVRVKYQAKYDVSSTAKPPSLIQKFSQEQIREEFKVFCKEKKLDYKEGLVLLNKFLNKQ
ncbi:metallophosphatase [Cellulophaga phage phi19:2]|uniref:Metallophosphatase n=3 Tax=Cellulophaga phage phiST TaxID=756282 RepID=M4SN99_9CAUD|nr:hypothetical protein CGPG_00056 [Cellulophaga phage phiST]AGH56755.1 hypothetical protein CGPG_00056 [Cellulophaga phage phiST]AGO47192.1 metallophosphatase [Cellulophaga phage phiST]AGO48688.1 metallophosphatase [Cellulophaga phage phi19:2]AGO49058.1 metallophosphatase [Cellulophaga phage phi13:1]